MMSAILMVLLACQPTAPKSSPDRVKEIRRAMAWLEEKDPLVQQLGRKRLLHLGEEAVPFLEEAIKIRGADRYVRILRQIERTSEFEESRWVSSSDLPTPGELQTTLPKVDRSSVDKYVRSRFLMAHGFARKGNFKRGFDMADALLTLESRPRYGEEIRKLRRYCENMILQTTFLEAKIIQAKHAYARDERVELTLRLRNIHKEAVTIRYGDAEDGVPAKGVVIIKIEARAPEPRGSQVTFMRSMEVPIEGDIPIATGAQWEKTFLLDTTVDLQDPDQMVIFAVEAWTHPIEVETDGNPITRRIQFEPALVKMVSPKHARFAENPLEWLGKSMDTGTWGEVFTCGMLLRADQKLEGVGMIIRAMGQSKWTEARQQMAQLLTYITDQRLGDDVARWTEWLQNELKTNKKGPE